MRRSSTVKSGPTRSDKIKNFHGEVQVSAVRLTRERRVGGGREASTAGLR